ncbi:MAG: ATP-binding protein, partial [Saprospiraceae bacterium]
LGENKTVWFTTTHRTLIHEGERSHYNYEFSFWSKTVDELPKPFDLSRNGGKATIQEKRYFFIHRTREGYWYVDIENQLNLFNHTGEWLCNYSDLGQFPRTDIRNSYEGNDYLWLASPIGLFKTSVKTNPFEFIHGSSEGYSDCRGITEDEEGNIYFFNRGIHKWNPKKLQTEKLTNLGANALIYHDNNLWASRYSNHEFGFEFDLNTKTKSFYRSPIATSAYTLLKTKNTHQYLVGLTKGICYIDLQENKTIPFEQYNDFDLLKTSIVNHLYQNAQGIWIASRDGVFLLSEKDGIIRHYSVDSKDLPFNHIRHIHEDAAGIFWLATKGGGLIKWMPAINDFEKSKWQQWTKKENLTNDFIYAVYEDDYQRLWLPSDKGLMCMDKETANIRAFSVSEGLPHHEFNNTSHYQAKDGALYFGGLGGLITFHPSDFKDLFTNQVPLALTEVSLWEEGVDQLIDKTKVSQQTKEINIYPSEKFLKVHFALLDYADIQQHNYAYKIEGYSNNWNYIKENNLRIPTLPYGNYTLKIKGKNAQKSWSDNEMSIKLNVFKPFYLKWWFILSLVLLLIALIILMFKRRVTQLQKDQQRLEDEVEKRTLTIKQQTEDLKQLDIAKSRFFSNLTHEFRTPLTLIIGPVEQLLAGYAQTATAQKLKIVLRNANQLLDLVNQMLTLTKMEDGQMKIDVEHSDIIYHTARLTKDFKPLAAEKRQKLIFNAEVKQWETYFDSHKWNRIVYNLIANAIKFTLIGGEITVGLNQKKVAGEALIELVVKDNGIGIEEKQLNHIFDRFYQGDSSSTRQAEGTGIGLALVKELVELQGGNISITSILGKGTSFVVELPVISSDAVKPALTPTPDPLIISAPISSNLLLSPPSDMDSKDSNKLDLLIIEDNNEVRAFIRHCLDENQYNITEAVNGEEGIQKAQELIPDLIISDVMMPKKDGFEVVNAIRKEIATSHIPIILLTAKTSFESQLEGVSRGADVYLTKPFRPQELVLRIQKLIEIRQLLQQRYQQQPVLASGKILEQRDEARFEEEDQFITELRAFIHEHINADNLNGDKIGKHFGISRGHLHRKIKAITNQSTGEYIKSVRLEKALEFLKEKKLNISEITYQTGFSSPSHFTRVFKKAYGKTPSEV